MSDQKINITLTADNSDLKKAVEDSTNKLLHLGESGQEAMDRTASATEQMAAQMSESKGAIDQVREAIEATGKATAQAAQDINDFNEKLKKEKNWENFKKGFGDAFAKIGAETIKLAKDAFKGAYEELLKVGEAADKIGMSVNGFQVLRKAAQDTREDLGTVTAAVQNVGKQALSALSGDSGAISAFKQLGISIDELRGKNPEQLFDLVTSACHALGDSIDGPDGVAAKTRIFGDSFKDLNGFVGKYREMTDGGLQGAFSEEAVRQAQELQRGIDDLKAALIAIAADTGFVNWLNGVVNSLRDVAGLKKLISETRDTIHDRGKEHNENLSWWRRTGALVVDAFNPIGYLQRGGNYVANKLFGAEQAFGRSTGQWLFGYQKEGVDFYSDAPTNDELGKSRNRQAKYAAERSQRQQNIQQYQQNPDAYLAESGGKAAQDAIEKQQADATKRALSDAERTYDAAKRRLESANRQIDAIEAAAEQQREAAYIAKKSANVDKKSAKLEKFDFQPIKRRKNARLDAGIAQKLELEAAGEKVKFTREEKRRMRRRQKAADALEKAQKELARAQEEQKQRAEQKKQDAYAAAKKEQQAAVKAQSDAAQKLAALTSQSNEKLTQIASGIQELAGRIYIVK